MEIVAILQAIAIWCGPPIESSSPWKKWAYSPTDVTACRDKMVECVQLNKDPDTDRLDLKTVVICFRAMSFGEIRKPK